MFQTHANSCVGHSEHVTFSPCPLPLLIWIGSIQLPNTFLAPALLEICRTNSPMQLLFLSREMI